MKTKFLLTYLLVVSALCHIVAQEKKETGTLVL